MARSKLRRWIAAGTGLALCAGFAVAQVPDTALKLAPPAAGDASARVQERGAIFAADGTWHANHEMRLRSDGNLPGQLRSFDAAGNLTPVRARLFFLQNGQIVGRSTATDDGMFQVVGLEPGTYSVIAASPEGFGAFGLHVVPPKAGVEPKVKSIRGKTIREVAYDAEEDLPTTMSLDISLVPPADFATMSTIMQSQIPGIFSGGGGALGGMGGALGGAGGGGGGIGGGGGGLGGLVGAGAAIGGLGALIGSQNNNNNTASSGS